MLFDLGETLLRFDKVDVINVYREAAHHSCEYLKELGQPVDHFMSYLWRNILGMRWKLFKKFDMTVTDQRAVGEERDQQAFPFGVGVDVQEIGANQRLATGEQEP